MDWVILLAAGIAAAVGLAFAARGSATRTARGSGSVGSGMLGVVDEIFAPNRHETMLELERQTSLPAPAPAPGDGDLGVYEGRIRIRVGDDA